MPSIASIKPTVPKIAFAGDSVMTHLHPDTAASWLLHAMMDQPRLYIWDPLHPGAVAHAGTDGGTGTGALTNATVIADSIAYGADIIFGQTSGNSPPGIGLEVVFTQIATYCKAIWAAKPTAQFWWMVPPPQDGRELPHIAQLHGYLRAFEKQNGLFHVWDMGEFMRDNTTPNAPIGRSTAPLGGPADNTGLHPTASLANRQEVRDYGNRILDAAGVPRTSQYITPKNDIYHATTMPGGNMLVYGGTAMGCMDGTQAPFGTPAKYTGAVATNWIPVTPTEMTVNGVALDTLAYKGNVLRCQSLEINTGAIALTGADACGWQRTSLAFPTNVPARFHGLFALENVVGMTSFGIQVTGNVGGVFTSFLVGNAAATQLSEVWGGGDPVSRILHINPGIIFLFDSLPTLYIRARFAPGTTPSGKIKAASAAFLPQMDARVAAIWAAL